MRLLTTTTRPPRNPTRRNALVVLAVAAGVALSACGDDGSAQADRAGGATVRIEQSRFQPDELTVAAGTTVAFVNDDPVDHTVTARDETPGDFDSGTLAGDETFEHRFAEPGTYDYFCEIHPTMRSSIVVAAS